LIVLFAGGALVRALGAREAPGGALDALVFVAVFEVSVRAALTTLFIVKV